MRISNTVPPIFATESVQHSEYYLHRSSSPYLATRTPKPIPKSISLVLNYLFLDPRP